MLNFCTIVDGQNGSTETVNRNRPDRTGMGREHGDPLPKKTDQENCRHSRPTELDPPTDKNEESSPVATSVVFSFTYKNSLKFKSVGYVNTLPMNLKALWDAYA